MNFQKVYGCRVICIGMVILFMGCVRVKVETSAPPLFSEIDIQTRISQESCPVPPFPQQSEVIHSLQVTKHSYVDLTSKEADEILSEATKVARTKEEGEINFPCRITLMRQISVSENQRGTEEDKIKNFPLPTAEEEPATEEPDISDWNDCVDLVRGDICSREDFIFINALEPQGVKVVELIGWCGIQGTGLIGGCSNQPGNSMAVARYCTDGGCPELEGVLWLHEFGHNKNLSHRHEEDPEPAVMHKGVNSKHTSLNECECQNLRKTGTNLIGM